MSRFDDELRHIAEQLADEPLPTGVLDEGLDHVPARGQGLRVAASVVLMTVLLVGVGIGIGQVLPVPPPDETPAASTEASPSGPAAGCRDEEEPPTSGLLVVVYFPCAADPAAPPARRFRAVPPEAFTQQRLELAVEALLAGPDDTERADGLAGVIPAGLGDLVLAVGSTEDGLAQVVFSQELFEIDNLSTSAAGGAFIRAVEQTVLGFAEFTAVELRAANGGCEAFFAFFGSSCQLLAEPLPETPCPLIEPAELPSGAPIGEPRAFPGQPLAVWGMHDDAVMEAVARSGTADEGGTPVEVRGNPGWVRPAGDLPMTVPMEITWVEGDCSYSIFVGLGGEDAAVEYAGRIGRVIAQPSLPPAEAVRHEHEDQGIRLTIELDRERTIPGHPIFATATVRNVGSDTVYWGHSSTCAYPVDIRVMPLDTVLDPGRAWTGEDALTKRLMVNEGRDELSLEDGFGPAEWLDREGMACTTDLVTSSIAAGEQLTHELAWDALGPLDMPLTGLHELTASFGYMSRGAPPAFDEVPGRFSVSMTFTIEVAGPGLDLVSPGVAFDALLDDPGYRALLEDAPRERRVTSDMSYVDGRWIAIIFLQDASGAVAPDAVIGEVDALTGEVVRARIGPAEQPPGG